MAAVRVSGDAGGAVVSNPRFRAAEEFHGVPEHSTRLDKYPRARQHDLFGCIRRNGRPVLALGIEAKACEGFDGLVADRATAAAPSNKRARCNLLSRALFGLDVLDEESGEILNEGLSRHGYQLWTAAVGSVIEAQKRRLSDALLVVQQFVPVGIPAVVLAGDDRDWSTALAANADAFDQFADELEASGCASRKTEFVDAGTTLHVVKRESTLTV